MIRRGALLMLACWGAALFAYTMAVIPAREAIHLSPSDKVEHILAFATITLLARLAYPAIPAWRLMLVFTGFGALIELTQAIPALHRDASWWDLVADMAASAVMLILTIPLAGFLRRRRWDSNPR